MARREAWAVSETKTMVLFMHDFLRGRFDSRLTRDIIEREKAKTQPSGMTAWSYLLQLQHSVDDWNLGEVNHTKGSCQTKWSRYLQTTLHEVVGVPTEKVLFLYHKLGLKLSEEAVQRIAREYTEYAMIWRGGVLKDYKKKVNVKMETRTAEDGSEERRREDRSVISSPDRGNVESSQYEIDSSGGEEEDRDSPRREQRRVKRERGEDAVEENRTGEKSAVVAKKVKKEVEENIEVKPNRASIDATRNQIDPKKKIKDEPSRRDTVPMVERQIDNGERSENGTDAIRATPLLPTATAATPSMSPTSMTPPEASKMTTSDLSRVNGEEKGDGGMKNGIERRPVVPSPNRLDDGERDTVVGIRDQATASVEGSEREGEDEERKKIEEGKGRVEETLAVRAYAAAAALLSAGGSEMQQREKKECSNEWREGERLEKRMRKRRMEREGGEERMMRMMKILGVSRRFKMMCEIRATSATFVTRGEVTTIALWAELFDEKSGKRLWLDDAIGEITEEDPKVKETMRRKLCGDIAVDRLEEAMEDALEEESTWE